MTCSTPRPAASARELRAMLRWLEQIKPDLEQRRIDEMEKRWRQAMLEQSTYLLPATPIGAPLATPAEMPRAICPICGQSIRTYQDSGATLLEYHRAAGNWNWCAGSDYNLSESD